MAQKAGIKECFYTFSRNQCTSFQNIISYHPGQKNVVYEYDLKEERVLYN